MLSVKPIENAGQAEHYFFEVDNYYLDNQTDIERTTAWWGEGATHLGLAGHVDRNIFRQLLDGRLPNGQILGRFRNGERQHRAGYDLTFSAPKSVSILAEICQAKEIHAAHETAVNKTLAMIQKECAQARMFKNGKNNFVDTNNLAVAKIRHDVSRALDAHLHTHCLVMNVTQRSEDKKWRALARQDYKAAITAETNGFLERVITQQRHYGAIYRAHLAHQLTQQGYAIRRTHKGCIFEVVGVPKELIISQSKRRTQIEALLQKQGRTGAHAAAAATLATRVAKRAVDRAVLHEFWQAEAAALGISLDEVAKNAKAANKTQEVTRTPEQAVTFAIKHLSEREACFSHVNLNDEALGYILGKVPPEIIHEEIKKFTQAGKLIVADLGNGDAYWTTPEAIELEKATIQLMQDGQKTVAPLATKEKIAQLLNGAIVQNILADKTLTQGQRSAITMILTSQDRVVGVQGDPGTGKTTMFKVIKAALEEQGYRVLGLAASANASRQIYKETGIKSMTLAAYLVAAEKADLLTVTEKDPTKYPEKVLGDSKTIIIVDEASLVASKDMHDFLVATAKRNIRVVPTGDTKQLDPVMAGRPFYQLQNYGMETAYMKEIIRQKNQVLRDSIDCAIQKEMAVAVAKLGTRVCENKDKYACLDRLADFFLILPQRERQQTVVGTGSREDRGTLNTLIRDGLKFEGVIRGKQLETTILEAADFTSEEKCVADYYQPEQVVRFGKEYSSLGIGKNEYLTVVAIDKNSNTVTLKNNNGKLILWNPEKFGGRRKGVVEVFNVNLRMIAAGDLIRWTRNNHQEKIFNGGLAKVTSVANNKITVQELIDNQPTDRVITFDPRSQRHQHWSYAYTSTIHGLQGATCKRILVYQDAYNINLTTQKSFLVAISRAQYEAYIFTNDRKKYVETLQKYSGEKTTALGGERAAQDKEKSKRLRAVAANKDAVKSGATVRIRKVAQPKPKPQWDANVISDALTARTEEMVGKLLGDPQKRSGDVWRYGTKKGSLIVTVQGGKRGFWYDFQTEKGGNLLRLIQEQTNLDFKKTLDYAAQLLGLSETDKVIAPNMVAKTQAKNARAQLAKEQPLTAQQLKMKQYVKKLEAQSLPAKGTIVERYLREHRGIKSGALPESIRFHPRVWDSNTKQAYPAMLAIAKDASGVTQSVQATYLDPKTANKAKIEQQKRTYGSVRGAAVRMSVGRDGSVGKDGSTKRGEDVVRGESVVRNGDTTRDGNALLGKVARDGSKLLENTARDESALRDRDALLGKAGMKSAIAPGAGAGANVATTTAAVSSVPEAFPQIALAEGVETALSVAIARPDLQVYATLGVSNFANFPVGENTKRLIICADNDGKNSDSQKLVDRVASRLLDKGVEAKIIQPVQEGQDFNDVLQSGGIDAVRKIIEDAGVKVKEIEGSGRGEIILESGSADNANRNTSVNNIPGDIRATENVKNLAQIYKPMSNNPTRIKNSEAPQRLQITRKDGAIQATPTRNSSQRVQAENEPHRTVEASRAVEVSRTISDATSEASSSETLRVARDATSQAVKDGAPRVTRDEVPRTINTEISKPISNGMSRTAPAPAEQIKISTVSDQPRTIELPTNLSANIHPLDAINFRSNSAAITKNPSSTIDTRRQQTLSKPKDFDREM